MFKCSQHLESPFLRNSTNVCQFWDARLPHAARSVSGAFVCGEGLSFDRRGRELLVASWRPGNDQLQVRPALFYRNYIIYLKKYNFEKTVKNTAKK